MNQIKYVDIHCHPNLEGLREDQEGVVETMRTEGVLGIVVGTKLQSSKDALELAKKHSHLWATVGLHPNYTQKETFDGPLYRTMLADEKVVAVGECGIDYFRQSTTASDEEHKEGWKEKQWEVFKQHVELAAEYDKPLMIHCRPSKGTMDAYEEVATYFEAYSENGQNPGFSQKRARGNMHFFVGDLATAKRFWKLGFTTSFTGVLTFTKDYDEVVREAPLDMILTETDAPWAAPLPYRGKTNKPEYVAYVVEAIARIRGEPVEDIRQAVLKNAERVFGLRIEP